MLAQWLTEAALSLEDAFGERDTLDKACRSCVAVIAGCTSAAISEGRESDRALLLAASDETARTLHETQFTDGEGPCVDAIWNERMVLCDDLRAEPRWPKFAAAALTEGMRSALVIRLYTHSSTLGALSLYADEPGAFEEVTRDVAQIFASHIAFALAGARRNAELSRGLTTRQRIGQATGILAERHGLTTDDAFAMLVRTSQRHNIRIRDLSDQFVTLEDRNRKPTRRTASGPAVPRGER